MYRVLILGCVLSLFVYGGCGDDGVAESDAITCGPGTDQIDGTCRPAISCGDGTIQQDTLCLPDGDQLSCGEGTTAGMNAAGDAICVPTDAVNCGEGTELVGEDCVAIGAVGCGEGTELNDANECVAIGQLACGEGTSVSEDGQICVANCDSGDVWDITSQSCQQQCGPGTIYDGEQGVCTPQCVDDEYFVHGVGCLHVPECLGGSSVDPASGNCEAWPFDELSLDRICSRRAVRFCEQHVNCCNGYGSYHDPAGHNADEHEVPYPGEAIEPWRFTDMGYPADLAGCLSREVTLCEAGVRMDVGIVVPGVSLIRSLVERGELTVSDEALATFDAIWTATDVCFLDWTLEELLVAPFASAALNLGLDMRLPAAILSLAEGALADGESCSELWDFGIHTCESRFCDEDRAASEEEEGEPRICAARAPRTTFDGVGAPLESELCSTRPCEAGTLCTETLFGDVSAPDTYYLCTPPKTEGERCGDTQQFTEDVYPADTVVLNPCAPGLVCRDGYDDPDTRTRRCRPPGETDDSCDTRTKDFPVCADAHWCSRPPRGRTGTCQPVAGEGEPCSGVGLGCADGLVCRYPDGWESEDELGSSYCLPPIAGGQPCLIKGSFVEGDFEASPAWCGPERYCDDDANSCDDAEPRTCASSSSNRVGNCLDRLDPGDQCFFCEEGLGGETGCRETDLCWFNGDAEGMPTPACNAGLSICAFSFQDSYGVCSGWPSWFSDDGGGS